MDVIAGLDSRPNLLNLTPTEFEHLVKQLFVAMGAEDVIPGTSPPKRLRASANVQTGRPGPDQP